MPPSPAARPRLALVAGGTGAVGRAVVARLLADGERVVVPYVDPDEADALRGAHPAALDDGDLRLSEVDVADDQALAAFVDVVVADHGPLWLACSLVGGFAGGTDVVDLDLDVLDRQLALNVRTAFAVAREGLRGMGPAGGRVVLTSSLTVRSPAAGQAPYTAAKAAVLALAQTLATELRGTGRTANAVLPRIVDTPANRAAMPDSDRATWVAPADVAAVVAWLASAEAWPVSGQGIAVDGGA